MPFYKLVLAMTLFYAFHLEFGVVYIKRYATLVPWLGEQVYVLHTNDSNFLKNDSILFLFDAANTKYFRKLDLSILWLIGYG